jgi:hypothetical protein
MTNDRLPVGRVAIVVGASDVVAFLASGPAAPISEATLQAYGA